MDRWTFCAKSGAAKTSARNQTRNTERKLLKHMVSPRLLAGSSSSGRVRSVQATDRPDDRFCENVLLMLDYTEAKEDFANRINRFIPIDSVDG